MYNRATEENINKVLFMREKNLRETNNNNKTLKKISYCEVYLRLD